MDSLMKYINRIHRCCNLYRGDMLEEDGLNAALFRYVARVCLHPGLSQEQLTRDVYINKSNTARQIATLEQNGYVTRQPDHTDRRVLRVYPTEKAQKIYPKLEYIRDHWNDYLLDGFTEEECTLLFSMLEKISKRATDYAETKKTDFSQK